jgi:hypothetical protein
MGLNWLFAPGLLPGAERTKPECRQARQHASDGFRQERQQQQQSSRDEKRCQNQ